jgi:cell division protein FtsL
MMAAGRSAQLSQPYLKRPDDIKWQQKRLELLRPEQEQRLAKRRWEAVPYILVSALLLAAVFAYMCLDAKIGQAGREINGLDTLIKENQILSQRTELEIGSLSSLARIESYAKLHLSMVYPDVGAMLYLDPIVSKMLATELAVLAEQIPAPPPKVQRRPLWELLRSYLSGTAQAVDN